MPELRGYPGVWPPSPLRMGYSGVGPRSRGTICPGLSVNDSPPRKNRRAWGMPGARCTRSLACKSRKHASKSPRSHRDHPAFPHAMVLTVSFGLLCPQNLPECANGRLIGNRPSLDLSPFVLEGREPDGEQGTDPVSSSTRTVAWASSPDRARKGAG
jgi:hypothetical protein